jgi:predicted secreted protein
MTTAAIGYGTLFQTGDGNSPEVWTTLAEVFEIAPPSLAREVIDASDVLLPGTWREFIPGMKDGGEISLALNFVPGGAAFAALEAELATSAIAHRRVLFPNGASYPFHAFVSGLDIKTPIDDRMTVAVKLKVSGQPGPLTV